MRNSVKAHLTIKIFLDLIDRIKKVILIIYETEVNTMRAVLKSRMKFIIEPEIDMKVEMMDIAIKKFLSK